MWATRQKKTIMNTVSESKFSQQKTETEGLNLHNNYDDLNEHKDNEEPEAIYLK